MTKIKRFILPSVCLLLVMCVAISGAALSPSPMADSTSSSGASSENTSSDTNSVPSITPGSSSSETASDNSNLTAQQKNSIAMLYYLSIVSEEIRASSNNRLLLEDMYNSLLNDLNPGAVDEITQEHLQDLRDNIQDYMNIIVKRERIQYIHNKNKADAIRSAIPNPLAILSATNSVNWISLATSAVYTVVDSYNSYKSASDAADHQFLLSTWELDDEETEIFRNNRDKSFDYMVDIVRKYGVDGNMTLNSKSIEKFVEICNDDEVTRKIRRLTSAEETYRLFGNYWLELAQCYFEARDFRKCLQCVDEYKNLAINIYRKDYDYAQLLPKVIVAAQNVYTGSEYIAKVRGFADEIISNTDSDDWSACYFVAQVFIDLYAKTNDRSYLESAYKIVKDNVCELIPEQKELNDTYLNSIKEATIEAPFSPDDEEKQAYEEELQKLKSYNEALKKARETELPPVYEPLAVNCELLFALADQLKIGYTEKSELEHILETATSTVFLSGPVNNRYSFYFTVKEGNIDFNEKRILIPVNLMTSETKVIVTVTDGGKTFVFDDCIISKVERKGKTIDTFYAHVTSKKLKNFSWSADSEILVEVSNGEGYQSFTSNHKVSKYKDNWFGEDEVKFERV